MRTTLLPKLSLVLALIFAAAVMTPLRRARTVFAPRSAVPTLVATRSPSLRRRPSRRPAIRREVGVRVRNAPIEATLTCRPAARGPTGVLSRSASSPGSKFQRHWRSDSVAKRPAPTVQHDDCDRMVDLVGAVGRTELSYSLGPPSPLAVTAQAVGDVPKPPPKSFAL
jgi:hypothetical protein